MSSETQSRAGHPSLCMISFEYPPFPGGIASYAANLVREAENWMDVTVIAPRYEDADPAERNVERLLAHHKFRIGAVSAVLGRLRALPRDALIHAADIRAGLYGVLARLLLGRRYIIMIHGSDVAKFEGWSLSKLPAYLSYALADRVVANSNYTKRIYDGNFPKGAACEAIPLGVGEDRFEPANGPFEHSALAAIPEETEIFCSVGRLERRKGHLLAIRALAAYKLREPDRKIVYVICGRTIEDDYEQDIRNLGRELDVDVCLAGPVSEGDLKRLYARASVHLLCALSLPGKIEGFGLVLLEAAALGCPSIATRVGGIPEVIADGRTGLLAEAETPQAVADAIVKLQEMRKTFDISRQCRDHAMTFSWKETARRTYEAYLARYR